MQGGADPLTILHPKLYSSKQEWGQDLGSKACLAHCLPAHKAMFSLGVSISVPRTTLKTQVMVKEHQGQINPL